MKIFQWMLSSCLLLVMQSTTESGASQPENDLWIRFDETPDRMDDLCGGAHLCRNKYSMWSNNSVNDTENESWNATAVISPNRMNDIQ